MDDLISRKDLLSLLHKWQVNVKRGMQKGLMKQTILDTLDHVIEDVENMPAQPEQRRIQLADWSQEV